MSSKLNSINTFTSSIGLVIFRIALGFIFFMHGWQKVVTNGIGGTADMFKHMGIPAPEVSAAFAGWVELIGGILVIAGLATRIIGILFAIDMAGAYWFVHKAAGFWSTGGGYEYVLILGASGLLLAGVGAGALSLDRLVAGRREGKAVVAES